MILSIFYLTNCPNKGAASPATVQAYKLDMFVVLLGRIWLNAE